MKLSKREKTMLIVLAVFVAVTAVWMLALEPLLLGLDAKRAQYSDLQVQQAEMKSALTRADEAGSQLEEQQKLADSNYDEFYSTLNSYTIDTIVNGLLNDNALEVESLSISPYESVSDAELFGLPEETDTGSAATESDAAPENGYLLRSTVRLQAGGAYEDILSFIDAMNDKSFCLRVSELSVSYSTDANKYDYEARLVCTIYIYGIEKPAGSDLA